MGLYSIFGNIMGLIKAVIHSGSQYSAISARFVALRSLALIIELILLSKTF